MAIADKFSASNYWKEVFECNAKYIHYIGEMMRYVVESPQSPYDTAHGVKVAAGSQLRYDVWPKLTVKIKTIFKFLPLSGIQANLLAT